MAVAMSVFGALVILGSSLPWTHYWAGGDTSPINPSGLTFPSEWGVWTLMIGMAIIFGALLAVSLVSPYRYLLMAVPAALGVALSTVSSVRRVPLSIGVSISGSVDAGLALVLASSVFALVITAVAGVVDWRWSRDKPASAN